MDKSPLITIIVSVYNGERYLEECIESVLNQDYQQIELIAVDDGSSDFSGRILDKYAQKDKRMIVVHKENSGVSLSRNYALDMAKGDYVALLDQDDILSPHYISYFYSLIKNNNAEIAITPRPNIFFKTRPIVDKGSDDIKICAGYSMAQEMLYHKIVIAPWNKLISKKLIEEKHIRFNKDYFNGEGFAFSIECFLNAKRVAVGDKKVYYYRVGNPDSGASIFKEKYILSSIHAQEYIKHILCDYGCKSLEKAWHFSNWHTHCDAFNIMVGCGVAKQYPLLYSSIKKVCKRQALCALSAPISLQQKFRGIMFALSPYFAATVINFFRIRKFRKTDVNICKPIGGGKIRQHILFDLFTDCSVYPAVAA